MENVVDVTDSIAVSWSSGNQPRPRFSILIPTRNRPEWLRQSVQAALDQKFDHFEVIVVDNSDPGKSPTEDIVAEITSSKLRYIRTGGLSMPNNWQAAVEAALGDFFIICSDKLILVPGLLGFLDQTIRETNGRVVVWKLGSSSQAKDLQFNEISVRSVPGSWIWEGAAQGAWRVLYDAGARGMNSAIDRRLVGEVESKLGAPFCRPCTPDYSIAITLGALEYESLVLDAVGATFLSDAHGTGMLALMAPDDETVRKQFSVPEVVDLPIKFVTGTNLIYQDICSLNHLLPSEKRRAINWEMYYVQLIHQAVNADDMGGFGETRKKEMLAVLRTQPLRFRLSLLKTVVIQEFQNLVRRKWSYSFQARRMVRLIKYALVPLIS